MGKSSGKIDHIGEYAVHRLIGQGPQGKVYECVREGSDVHCAMKVLSRDLAKDEECVERFEQNAAAASRLSHSGIVGVHEIGTFKGRYYFTMEAVKGRNLRDCLPDGAKLPGPKALELLGQAVEALDYAHQKGVGHGRLKAENLIVTKDGTVKISDFSPANLAGSDAGGASEQGDADRQSDPPSVSDAARQDDIRDLGLTFLGALRGEFIETEDGGVPELVEEDFDKVPNDIRPLIRRMCDPDSESRFPDTGKLLAAINHSKSDEELDDLRTVEVSSPKLEEEEGPAEEPDAPEEEDASPVSGAGVKAVELPEAGAPPPVKEEPMPVEEEAPTAAPRPQKGGRGRKSEAETEEWNKPVIAVAAVLALAVGAAAIFVYQRSQRTENGPEPGGTEYTEQTPREADDPGDRTPSDPSAPRPDSGSSDTAAAEEGRTFRGFAEELEATEPQARDLMASGRFGKALDLYLDLELNYADVKDAQEIIKQRQDRLFAEADKAFAVIEKQAREVGDPTKAIALLEQVVDTFELASLEDRAEALKREFRSLLAQGGKEEPAEDPEAGTAPASPEEGDPGEAEKPSADPEEGGAGTTEPTEAEPPTEVVAAPLDHLAESLLPILRIRDYSSARKMCEGSSATVKAPDDQQHVRTLLDLLGVAEQYWSDVEKGALDMVGKPCSLGVQRGSGSIKVGGNLTGVKGRRLVLESSGREMTIPIRSLQAEDAARLASSVVSPFEATTQRAIGVVYLLDGNLPKADELLTMAKDGGQDVDALIAVAGDAESLPRRVVSMVEQEKVKALLGALKKGVSGTRAQDLKARLEKAGEEWKGTPLGEEIKAELEKLAKDTGPSSNELAERMWKKLESDFKKEKWKKVLLAAGQLTKRYGETEIVQSHGEDLVDLVLQAGMGLCVDSADTADSREIRSLPSPGRPNVVLIKPDGKGEEKTFKSALLHCAAGGAVLASAGLFSDQIAMKGMRGTAKMPCAIMGVPGGKTVLTSYKLIEGVRSDPDEKTVWFPWMQAPPKGDLLQDSRLLAAAKEKPTAPGTYFFDQKAKRCFVSPFPVPEGEKPVLKLQVPQGRVTLSVAGSSNVLIRDLWMEWTNAAVSFQKTATDITLERVGAFKHGPFTFLGGPVTLRECFLPIACTFPGAERILATKCVFGTVGLSAAKDFSQEVMFRDCVFLGGLKTGNDPHTRLIIKNCVFYGCDNGVEMVSGKNVEISDCIFMESAQAAISSAKEGEAPKVKNTCFWRNGADYGGVAEEGTNCVAEDPLFNSWDKGDFRLQKESPCRGKAADGGDLGPRWSSTQWGRWFRFLKAHPGVL